MPVFTYDNVIDDAAVLLNDSGKALYTATILGQHFRKAYQELVETLQLNSVPVVYEDSAALTVPANTTRIAISGTVPLLPGDVILPLSIRERPSGSSSAVAYLPMVERTWDPNIVPGDSLSYYSWREQEIKLIGSTLSNDIIISYIKDLAIPTTGQSLAIHNAYLFLTSRIAELAAGKRGEDKDRADDLKVDALVALDKVISFAILGMQNNPSRRKPFRRR